jgi:hypothetical protein
MEYLAPLFEVLTEHIGPVGAILFLVCCFLAWLVLSDRWKTKDELLLVPAEYQKLLDELRDDKQKHHAELVRINDRFHEAIVDSTRALERLAILLEERTRRQSKL